MTPFFNFGNIFPASTPHCFVFYPFRMAFFKLRVRCQKLTVGYRVQDSNAVRLIRSSWECGKAW